MGTGETVLKPRGFLVKTLKRCQTQFLGWNRPLLWTAVEYLRTKHGPTPGQAQRWQLDHFLVVLPTRRSGRRLRELLERTAARDSLSLLAPQIITAGELPEYLYSRPADTELADEFERTLAWTTALQQTDSSDLAPVFPALPQRDAWSAWIELATTIRKLHEDLASSNLTFADVAIELAKDDTMASEQARWELLQSLHDQYINSLAVAGRTDPFLVRRDAIEQKRCKCDRHILLIGTSDLSDSVTVMLRQISQHSPNNSDADSDDIAVTALIAADEHYRDHFDPFGSIIASRWCQWKLPIDDSQLVPAGDVTDQSAALSQWVQEIQTKNFQIEPSDVAITVGVANESLVPPIEFEIRQIGRKSYRETRLELFTNTDRPSNRIAR
jgi:ATP-dependent helicase/nuclease subunit B